jgi:hypothetical protein
LPSIHRCLLGNANGTSKSLSLSLSPLYTQHHRLEEEARQKAAADAETLRKQQKIDEMFGKTSATSNVSAPPADAAPKSSLVERMRAKKQAEAEAKVCSLSLLLSCIDVCVLGKRRGPEAC